RDPHMVLDLAEVEVPMFRINDDPVVAERHRNLTDRRRLQRDPQPHRGLAAGELLLEDVPPLDHGWRPSATAISAAGTPTRRQVSRICDQVRSSRSMPSRKRRAFVRSSGSPGARISPSGVAFLALFTWVMKRCSSAAKSSSVRKRSGSSRMLSMLL